MRFNFGGQTAALPDESISNPERSIGHEISDPEPAQGEQEPEEERLTLEVWDEWFHDCGDESD